MPVSSRRDSRRGDDKGEVLTGPGQAHRGEARRPEEIEDRGDRAGAVVALVEGNDGLGGIIGDDDIPEHEASPRG